MIVYDMFLRVLFALFLGPAKGTFDPVALIEVFARGM